MPNGATVHILMMRRDGHWQLSHERSDTGGDEDADRKNEAFPHIQLL